MRTQRACGHSKRVIFLFSTCQQLTWNLIELSQFIIIMSLIIKPISAQLITDADMLGKADPYVICQIGQEKRKSATCSSGGKNPTWADTFVFGIKHIQSMRIQVWDEDTFTDDFIGEATVDLKQLFLYPNQVQTQFLDLTRENKPQGRIQISMEYQGPVLPGFQQGGPYDWPQTPGSPYFQGGGQQSGNW